MESKEINPEGDFTNWSPQVLSLLKEGNFTTQVGGKLLFENNSLKVWTIKLVSNESLPFHKHNKNYNWTALTNGSAISHYETGRIVRIEYQKGDQSYYNHDTKGDFVHNLMNTGDTILEFVTVEYKN